MFWQTSALFDRLSDDAPFSAQEMGYPGVGLHESVCAELSRLLSTRRHRQPYLRQANVLDYGLPDWSSVGRHNAEEQARLVGIIQSTVQQYEPRLKNVRVEIVHSIGPQNTIPSSITLRIHAELRHDNTLLSLRVRLLPDRATEVTHERID